MSLFRRLVDSVSVCHCLGAAVSRCLSVSVLVSGCLCLDASMSWCLGVSSPFLFLAPSSLFLFFHPLLPCSFSLPPSLSMILLASYFVLPSSICSHPSCFFFLRASFFLGLVSFFLLRPLFFLRLCSPLLCLARLCLTLWLVSLL